MYKDLVSITIPAYDNPEYLLKNLNSILKQSYRPIEVIISDDKSPTPLKNIVENFKKYIDSDFSIKFYEQKKNLNVYWNALFVKQHASGKYICQSAHDDWFIDKDFIKCAVEELKKNSDCFIAAASFCEEPISDEININAKYNWSKINEIDFIKSIWSKNNFMLSSSILDFEKLKKMNYFDMFISKSDAIKINIEPDEAHLPYNLLSFNSNILISNKIVVVRGTPEFSYSRLKNWKLKKNKSVFINIYNIYKFYKINSNIELANLYKNLIIKKFSVEKIYYDLFLFLKSFDSLKILVQSYLYFHFKKYNYIINKYLKIKW